ncbi:hypothetical protein D9M69_524910 [compost metagenome]
MESGSQAPQSRFEQAPVPTGPAIERVPSPYAPEIGVETGAERREAAAESAARQADGVPALPTPVLPTIIPQAPADDTTVVHDDTPLLAADEDLIEKEWVDKAKKIILETKDDPYAREAAVTRLQADYLRKRYGKELGSAD